VAGLAASFGSGAMTNSINEISDAACIFAIGTNTTANHPIIGRQVTRAVQKGSRLIVVDPRQIPLCRMADIWLRLRPGTDIALLNGIMRVIIDAKIMKPLRPPSWRMTWQPLRKLPVFTHRT